MRLEYLYVNEDETSVAKGYKHILTLVKFFFDYTKYAYGIILLFGIYAIENFLNGSAINSYNPAIITGIGMVFLIVFFVSLSKLEEKIIDLGSDGISILKLAAKEKYENTMFEEKTLDVKVLKISKFSDGTCKFLIEYCGDEDADLSEVFFKIDYINEFDVVENDIISIQSVKYKFKHFNEIVHLSIIKKYS